MDAPPAGRRAAAPTLRLVADDRMGWLTALLVGVLVIYLTVPEGFDYTVKDDIATGSAATKMVWIGMLVLSLAVLAWRAGLAWLLASRINRFVFVFLLLAAVSVLWSIAPPFTLKRVVRLLTFLLAGMAFAVVGWHERRFQNVVRPLLTLLMAGSLLFGLLDPELAIEQSAQSELMGAWHGLAMQKNSLGALAGMGALFWLHAWLAGSGARWRELAGGALCVTCLVLSRSSTSLMATVFAALLLLLLLRSSANLRPYMPYLVTLFAALIVIYSLAVLHLVPGSDLVLSPITALTGKDQSFSGRTAIWEIINAHIAERPLLGTGYGAYWIGPVPYSPSYTFVTHLNFYPTQSHNGYLEVVNDLGVAGGLCLLGFLVIYVRQSLELFRADMAQGALFLALFFQQLVANLSEARWFLSTSVDFAIMVLACVALARALLNVRLLELAGSAAIRSP
ncbi:MAG: O-antigen ligase family protein [Gammaproteobacteria bacterium]|nr:O-antigen ligase family protein [Gammaproteobacteria bacterium]